MYGKMRSINISLRGINIISVMSLATVLAVLVEATRAQAYLFSLSQGRNTFPNQYSNLSGRDAYTLVSNTETTDRPSNLTDIVVGQSYEDQRQDDNSTIFVTKNKKSSELSQTTMDVITIVWYVATFLALAAFFLLMACSDRRCSGADGSNNNNSNESPMTPPTPSPSYSEFAPPSYETVMKMQHSGKTSIFVIPFNGDDNEKENSSSRQSNNNSNNTTTTTTGTTTTTTTNNDSNVGNRLNTPTSTPVIDFYTINELQKLGAGNSSY